MFKLIKDYPIETQWEFVDDEEGVIGSARLLDHLNTGQTVWAVSHNISVIEFVAVLDEYGTKDNCRIVPVPVKRTGWMNIYADPLDDYMWHTYGVYPSKIEAEQFRHRGMRCVGCIEVEWVDQQGL
jgi:hypothetical protein